MYIYMHVYVSLRISVEEISRSMIPELSNKGSNKTLDTNTSSLERVILRDKGD